MRKINVTAKVPARSSSASLDFHVASQTQQDSRHVVRKVIPVAMMDFADILKQILESVDTIWDLVLIRLIQTARVQNHAVHSFPLV